MRITTGLFKSRIIRSLKHIRPTQDKTRKALFDILQNQINDTCFLELFAGSGAIGIEALSNGAKEVIFAEEDKKCCKVINNNLELLGFKANNENRDKNIFVLAMDAFKAIEVLHKNNKKFDIIFLDPPYYKEIASRLPSGLASAAYCDSLAKKTLQKLFEYDILRPCGLIVVEHSKKDGLEDKIGVLTLFKQNRYGDTVLSFYKKE